MANGIYKKLAEIQGELSVVGKSGKNKFQNYDYATEGDFLEVVRPLCAEKGICISTSAIEEQTEIGRFESVNAKGQAGLTRFAVVCVQTTLTDSEDGSSIVVVMPGYAEDTGDKALYKALTGATKYAVWKAFNLATGDDVENDQPKGQKQTLPGKPATPPSNGKTAPPAPAKTPPAPTQSIETMTIEELQVEFKARCKTNGVKASEKFKELMGDQLQEGVTFADLDSDKAKWLVLELPLF